MGICDNKELYYRGNPAYTHEKKKNNDNRGLNEPLDNISWYYDVGHKVFKDRTEPKTVFASGVKIPGTELSVEWLQKDNVIKVDGGGKLSLNEGYYTKWTQESDFPAWLKEDATVYKNLPVDGSEPQMIQFGGSKPFKPLHVPVPSGGKKLKKKQRKQREEDLRLRAEGITKHLDEWYLSADKKYCIFFDKIQGKWHICDKDTLYYRGNPAFTPGNIKKKSHKGKDEALNNISWFSDPGLSQKGQCSKCNAQKVTPEGHKSECDGTVSLDKKTVFASGMVDERRVKPTVCVKKSSEEIEAKKRDLECKIREAVKAVAQANSGGEHRSKAGIRNKLQAELAAMI